MDITKTDRDLLVEEQINSGNDPPIRVLVVDDSNSERKLLTKELSKRGYQITEAVDAIDALSKFSPKRSMWSCPITKCRQ